MTEPLAALLRAAGVDAFERPTWGLALIALALAAWAVGRRARPLALAWPALAEARAAGARRRDSIGQLARALRLGALVAVAAALAGPVGVHRAPPEPGMGLDLVLVLDASGSMRALDAQVAGEWRTRLDLARQVVSRFAARRAAKGDRVGLVVFGEVAFTQCPLTGDGELLAAALRRVGPGVAGEATALGDALALTVKRATGAPGGAAGRVGVLLTDGRNNAGAVSVDAAAALAAAEGLRVHTVAIGSAGEAVSMESDESAAGHGLRFERHDVDTAALEWIAATTGGRFFAAQRSSDLAAIYAEIDALERVARPLPPRIRHTERPEPALSLAGGLLLFEIAIARVARRRLP